MAGFLSLTGAAAANDLGIGSNPALPTDLTDEEIRKKRKQLQMMDQTRSGVGRAPNPNMGSSLSLLGQGY